MMIYINIFAYYNSQLYKVNTKFKKSYKQFPQTFMVTNVHVMKNISD
jgi:hypothetical protein